MFVLAVLLAFSASQKANSSYTANMIVQKYLAQKGICSRREAETLLKEGLIFVNGRKAVPGVPLKPSDQVTLSPKAEKQLSQSVTVAVYKPRGITCSVARTEGANIFDVFPQWQALNMVGRLDKESEGLLLLSNDGLVTRRLTGSDHEVEKEYEVKVQERVFLGKLQPIVRGMRLSDGPTLPAQVEVIDKNTFRIVLHEGRNRQIRRMCGELNMMVTSLKRTRIGSLELGRMRPGDWRRLTLAEVSRLKDSHQEL